MPATLKTGDLHAILALAGPFSCHGIFVSLRLWQQWQQCQGTHWTHLQRGNAVYTKGVAVTPDKPTSSGGAVTAYSVSPALPAGLTLNSGTGVISGTPTAVTPIASYTVTASGAAGSTTTSISVTVNDQPPSAFTYAAGTATYVVNTPITPNSPTNSGGTVVSYSVIPALPAGLSLSTTTGAISGTPRP